VTGNNFSRCVLDALKMINIFLNFTVCRYKVCNIGWLMLLCRFSAEPDERPPRGGGRGRGDRGGGLNRRWASEHNTTRNSGLLSQSLFIIVVMLFACLCGSVWRIVIEIEIRLGGVVSDLRLRGHRFDFRSSHYQVVTTRLGDCHWTGKSSRCVTTTKVNSAFYPSRVNKSSTGLFDWG